MPVGGGEELKGGERGNAAEKSVHIRAGAWQARVWERRVAGPTSAAPRPCAAVVTTHRTVHRSRQVKHPWLQFPCHAPFPVTPRASAAAQWAPIRRGVQASRPPGAPNPTRIPCGGQGPAIAPTFSAVSAPREKEAIGTRPETGVAKHGQREPSGQRPCERHPRCCKWLPVALEPPAARLSHCSKQI